MVSGAATPLTDLQLYEYMCRAGFPGKIAVTMTAVSLRESRGIPTAHNTTPPDDSYGLLQINMFGQLRALRLKLFGISDPARLLEPAMNATAGRILWNGNNHNLNVAWAINLEGYRQEYESFLPRAMAAALASSLGQ